MQSVVLLNLAAIYTTGFECPDTTRIIPELQSMLTGVYGTYVAFKFKFPQTPLTDNYLSTFKNAIQFTNSQPLDYSQLIILPLSAIVNPLFAMNQQLIRQYHISSKVMLIIALLRPVHPSLVKHCITDRIRKVFF